MEESDEFIDESFFTDDSDNVKSEVEVQKTGLENSFNERQVGSITVPIEPVSCRVSLDALLEQFTRQPDLQAIPIEEYDHVVGIIDRKTVEETTSSAFKRFVAKTAGEYVKRSSFTLNTNDFLEKVAAKVNDFALNEEVKYIVVLLNNRDFYGLVSVADINNKINQLRAHDLEKAEAIQQNMLKISSDTKKFPFDVCIWNRMANPVGGDFYLAEALNESTYITGVFDVSGKNVSAALLTVTIGSFFSMIKQFGSVDNVNITAQKLASLLDSYLQTIVPVGDFITGALAFVDHKNSKIELLNCGHTNVYIFLGDESGRVKVAELKPTLPPFGMGAVADALKTGSGGYKMPLKAGLQIDIYSDGLIDMQNADGVRYDESHTKQYFKDIYRVSSYDFEKETKKTVESWIGKAMLPDDITVMNIRF